MQTKTLSGDHSINGIDWAHRKKTRPATHDRSMDNDSGVYPLTQNKEQ